LAARLGGVLIITVPQKLWPLWPGCAVLVAVLLVSPRKTWPLLILGGLAGFVLYDVLAGVSPRTLSILLLADIVEILVAVWGIYYLLRGAHPLDSLKSFGKYALITVILGPFVASMIGIHASDVNPWTSWWNDFLSDGLAFLAIAPAILGWVDHFRTKPAVNRGFYFEAAALFTTLFFLCLGMFVIDPRHVSPAFLYSLVPFLLWSAIRFGSAGAGTAASIVSLVSIWGAVHGHGPFTETDPINRVLTLQLFLLFTAGPFMILAVLVEERKRQAAALRESGERFRLMADTTPTLI
jgi:integral membrane sensor domain MASE1